MIIELELDSEHQILLEEVMQFAIHNGLVDEFTPNERAIFEEILGRIKTK